MIKPRKLDINLTIKYIVCLKITKKAYDKDVKPWNYLL